MKKNKTFQLITSIVIAISMSSCATIMRGTYSKVAFDSNPKGATVYAVSRKGKFEVGTTPTVSSISKKTRSVEFRKDGYYTEEKAVEKHVEGWYYGNLLLLPLGGIPSLIAMAIDIISGSYLKLPEKIEAELKKKVE